MGGSSLCNLFTRKEEVAVEKPTEQLFRVEGMTCQHCVAAITRALQARDQLARIDVDLPAGLVRVNSAAAAAELLRVLAEEGYPATVVKA
jgi:copper chaperone